MEPDDEETVRAYVALPKNEEGVVSYFCQPEYEEPRSGYWLEIHFATLDAAREAAKQFLSAVGHAGINVATMQKCRDLSGRTYWMRGQVEIWAPFIPACDANDQKSRGKVVIDDEFVCFTIPEEMRQRLKELDPDPPDWLDNPPTSGQPPGR